MKLYFTQEAAEIIGISPGRLLRIARRMGAVKMFGSWRYSPELVNKIQTFMKKRRKEKRIERHEIGT